MVHGHFIKRCEHGVVTEQCRCMDTAKTLTIVACPPQCQAQKPPDDDHEEHLDAHIAMVKKHATGELCRQLERINDKHAGDLSRMAKQGWFCYGLIAGIAVMFVILGIVEVWRG